MKEIKTFIKSATFNELEKAAELINSALNSQREQEQKKVEVLALIKEKGLTVEDLLDSNAIDKRAKVKVKYKIQSGGEIHEWTGRGKTPKAFQGVDLAKYKV